MKNILIISNSPIINNDNIKELKLNDICEGSGRHAYLLYTFLSNKHNVYWVSKDIPKSLSEVKHIDELNYNINYDIVFCINDSVKSYNAVLKLKNMHNNCKFIFIAENSYYNKDILANLDKLYDKFIFISNFGKNVDGETINENKQLVIPNIITFDKYKKINLEKKKNNIIISYHFWKGNIDIFIKNIFPLIVKKIKDVQLIITTPIYVNHSYDYEEINRIINECSTKETINHIKFLGCLSQNKLFEQYELAKVSWHYTNILETFGYNVLDQLMFGVHPITSFNDSCLEFCTKEYIEKFKYDCNLLDDYHNCANIIIERMENYNKYFYLFDNIYKHIVNTFGYINVTNKYNELINNI